MPEVFHIEATPRTGRLRTLMDRLQSKRGLLKVLGELMLRSIQQTMEEEGSPAGSWRRLYAGTMQQQYEDRGKGKKRRQSWTRGRNTAGYLSFVKNKRLLYGSGTLYHSINYRVAENEVEIGTALKYAKIHQFGGVIRPLSHPYLIFPVGGGRFIKTKQVTIPARPFVVLRPEDPERLRQGVIDYLEATVQGAPDGGEASGS